MADITLSRPAAQTRQTVAGGADDRFVFDFSTGDATLSRDGDNLVFAFDDGASLELTDFYGTYDKENIPDFVVDGAEISGTDFFMAMNAPDLMPAAGPAAQQAQASRHDADWANSALYGGIDRLDGLDLGFDGPQIEYVRDGAAGGQGSGLLEPINFTPDIVTPPAAPKNPGRPADPNHPGNSEGGQGWVPAAANTNIIVDEGALAQGGSGLHTLHGAKGTGDFVVDVHGERGGSIVLTHGGVTVTLAIPEDDATVIPGSGETLEVNGVAVTVTGARLENGQWKVSYEYELTGNQTHDKDSGHDTTLSGGIAITVTDGSGDVATGQLNVEVHDDMPRFSVDATGETSSLDGEFGLHYGADGAHTQSALTADGASDTQVSGNTTTFTFDDGKLILTQGADGKYSYSFNPNDKGTTFEKQITLTATDSDGDTDTITLTVGKTVPVITPGENPDPDNPENPDDPNTPVVEVGKIVVDEGDQPEHGETETHTKTGTGSFNVELNGETEKCSILLGEAGQGINITFDADGNPEWDRNQAVTADGVQIVVTAVTPNGDGGWTVTYSYNLDGNQQHVDADGKPVDTLQSDVNITVTDASGDTASGVIHVEVHDDVPTITTSDYHSHQITDPTPQISLDFRADDFSGFTTGWNVNNTGFSKIEQNSVQIFASNVKYTYAADGSPVVEQVYDENGGSLEERIDGQPADIGNYGKFLSISQDGLGVGNKWGDSDIAAKPGEPTLAEALVLETKNGSVSYGMNLEFGRFEDGDKALVTFMLTPRNNNDDTVVLMKEVSYADLVNGKIHIDVPDGFTKVFISALPGTDTQHESAFTVKTLEMTRPSWEHEGVFTIDPGADGIKPDSFHWDVDLSNFGETPKVVVKGAPGSGLYDLALVDDPNDPNVKFFILSGKPNGENGTNLDGNALFIVRVDPSTGKWTIDQFYNFDLENGEKPIFDLTFQVTDSDGDVASASQTVNADLDVTLDRFQNVVDDTFNGADTKNDTNASILTGTEVNDLMYGRGGNDILFGDAGNDFENVLRNELTLWDKPATDYNQIWWRLNNSKPNADDPNGLQLEVILEKLEQYEGKGGDDALFGGLGNDILFGGAGNDYLYGNGKNKNDSDFKDKDMLFGGSGNDIMVYDENDAIIHGGSDIDILLAGKKDPSLAEMLDSGNGSGERPYVGGIEILIKSMNTDHVENLGITSHESLLQYGVKIEDGKLLLSGDWEFTSSQGGYSTYTYNVDGTTILTLETTLSADEIGKLDAEQADAQSIADAAAGDMAAYAAAAVSADMMDEADGTADNSLSGTEGNDFLYDGDGNDLIVYDSTDYLIHGGEGIDVLLSGSDAGLHLEDLLQADPNADKGPRVEDVEVLIKGADALDLTGMDDLAAKLGVTIDGDAMSLSGEWTRDEKASSDEYAVFTHESGVTLETSLTPVQTDTAAEAESQIQQFILQNSNG